MASSSDSTEDFLTLRVEERRARRLRRREKAKAARIHKEYRDRVTHDPIYIEMRKRWREQEYVWRV